MSELWVCDIDNRNVILALVREIMTLDLKMGTPTNLNYNEETISRSISIRLRQLLLIMIAYTSIYVIVSINISPDAFFKINEYIQTIYNNYENFTIKTQGCNIPAMQPINEFIDKFIYYPTKLKPCPNANYSLLEQNGTHIWLVNDTRILRHYKVGNRKHIRCCYSSFYRPNFISDITSMKLDQRITYNECIYFKNKITVNDEFVRVKCFLKNIILYDQFFLFTPLKNRTSEDDDKQANKSQENAYNVLVIGIDNLSRLNFHRTMPKTAEFMNSRGAVELMGYNKVGDNSFPNLIPLLMGYAEAGIKEICHPVKRTTYDDCPFLWHWYREAGYYTAFGEDSGKLGTFNYLMKGFRREPTDYYLHPFIAEAEKIAGKHRDFNVALCLNENYLFQVLLNYIQSITKTLRDLKLFGFFWETTFSHDNLNYPMAMDDSYLKFFNGLEYSNYLNSTIIFLISDHGMRWGSFRKTKQGYLEERLPLAYVLMPPSFPENYAVAFANFKQNSRHLTTPYDMHKTLRDLIDLENIKNEKILERTNNMNANDRGISLFLKIPQNRTCKSAGIAANWCTCTKRVEIPNTSEVIISASEYLIRHLNLFLSEYTQCVALELDEVLQSVVVLTDLEPGLKEDWKEYSVIVKVKPSDAVFEATLRNDGQKWSVTGSISRLNLYGDQSFCVHDPHLKLYCYCRKQ